MKGHAMYDFESHIVDIPDYPEPGVVFKDITPLFGNPEALKAMVDALDWCEIWAQSLWATVVSLSLRFSTRARSSRLLTRTLSSLAW